MKPEVGEPPARVKPHPLGREAPPAEPPARVKPHPPLRREARKVLGRPSVEPRVAMARGAEWRVEPSSVRSVLLCL